MTKVSENYQDNNANTLLCEVYLCIIETKKRILTIIEYTPCYV